MTGCIVKILMGFGLVCATVQQGQSWNDDWRSNNNVKPPFYDDPWRENIGTPWSDPWRTNIGPSWSDPGRENVGPHIPTAAAATATTPASEPPITGGGGVGFLSKTPECPPGFTFGFKKCVRNYRWF